MHGSHSLRRQRTNEDEQRVWIVYDWTVDGLRALQQSPDAAELFASSGLKGPPTPLEQVAELPS